MTSLDRARWDGMLRDAALKQMRPLLPARECPGCGKMFSPPKPRRASDGIRKTCSRSCAVSLSWKNPVAAAKRRASISAEKKTAKAQARLQAHNARRWSDPAERERLSEWNRKRWSKKGIRKKLIKAIKATHNTPEMRAFYSKQRKQDWQRPEYRDAVVSGMRAHHGTPEARAKFSALLKARWDDPELRAKYTAANANRNNPEHRARMSARAKAMWADPVSREKMLTIMRLYAASPESLAEKSARMKALWSDPVWRMKQQTFISKGRQPVGTPPATGEFKWRVDPSMKIKAGSRAGSTDNLGYRNIMIDGLSYKAHRLAWLYTHGYWPQELDHKDRDRANNRIENLRLATRSTNNFNSRKGSNKCGFRGVVKNTKNYRARIKVRGKEILFGSFDTPEAAHKAYKVAALEYFGEFAEPI